VGILGNVTIGGGISSSGAIVSAGLIGDDGSDNVLDDTLGTHLSISGNDKGILAAVEDINFQSALSFQVFENAASDTIGPNFKAINAVFTQNVPDLPVSVIDPADLFQLLTNLLNLRVDASGNLTDAPP
jgi:hypothetical protein